MPRARGREPLHLVSAGASRQRLVLGQEAVADKSNEIVAIPLLLQRLQLAGALVTIDAIGTQIEIAEAIVDGGGDYLLPLKANRPALLAKSKPSSPTPPTWTTVRPSKPSTATTAAWKSAATESATRSAGSSPIAARPTRARCRIWP